MNDDDLCIYCYDWKYCEEPRIPITAPIVKIKCENCGYIRTVPSRLTKEELQTINNRIDRVNSRWAF